MLYQNVASWIYEKISNIWYDKWNISEVKFKLKKQLIKFPESQWLKTKKSRIIYLYLYADSGLEDCLDIGSYLQIRQKSQYQY